MKLKQKIQQLKYRWEVNHGFHVKAQAAGEELQRLNAKGKLTPQRVVDAARKPTNPLHPAFDWNDATAAGKYRLTQARALIRSIRVIVSNGAERSTHAYLHLTDRSGLCYVDAQKVAEDVTLYQLALDEALGQLTGIRHRYEALQELRGVFHAIDKVTAQHKKKKAS